LAKKYLGTDDPAAVQKNFSKNKVSTIDIPYSSLTQPAWGKQVVFNKNTIESFLFSRTSELGLGTSTIKIFDIEVY